MSGSKFFCKKCNCEIDVKHYDGSTLPSYIIDGGDLYCCREHYINRDIPNDISRQKPKKKSDYKPKKVPYWRSIWSKYKKGNSDE